MDRINRFPSAATVVLGLSMLAPSLQGCNKNGSFGDEARDALEWSDDDSADTGDDDTCEPCDDDTGDDDTTDTGDDDTADTGDDDTSEPEMIAYSANMCISDAGGAVSSTTWLDEGGGEQEDLPDWSGSVVTLTLREEGGYGGLVMAVLESPDGDLALNVEGAQWVGAGDEQIVHFDSGWTLNNGDRLELTVYTVDGDPNVDVGGRCHARASDVESLYIENGGIH